MSAYPNRLPIVHVSAHGAQSGLQLSNGEVVTWPQLRELLLPVNKSLAGFLLLCMSACEGYSACQMAMELEGADHPYWALIGNFGKPTWSETAVAYAALYHLVYRFIDRYLFCGPCAMLTAWLENRLAPNWY